MKPLTVGVRESTGRILCCPIFRPCGKKLLAKGHQLSPDDVRLLETEGLQHVWVTELEAGEVGEDEAVSVVADAMACGSVEVKLAAGGRANLFATEDCCVLVDADLVKQINSHGSVAIATIPNFTHALTGRRIATVKSAPFAVSADGVEAVVSELRSRGRVIQARPIRKPVVAVLYSDPASGERARQLFESVVRQRLDKLGTVESHSAATVERAEQVTGSLKRLLALRPTVVLIASTTAPAGPEDEIGRALRDVGCQLEKFLAPVEPGNLLLMSYYGDIPLVSAPGCFRSTKPNVMDLILPPLLARYRLQGWEVDHLGHGGLLS